MALLNRFIEGAGYMPMLPQTGELPRLDNAPKIDECDKFLSFGELENLFEDFRSMYDKDGLPLPGTKDLIAENKPTRADRSEYCYFPDIADAPWVDSKTPPDSYFNYIAKRRKDAPAPEICFEDQEKQVIRNLKRANWLPDYSL